MPSHPPPESNSRSHAVHPGETLPPTQSLISTNSKDNTYSLSTGSTASSAHPTPSRSSASSSPVYHGLSLPGPPTTSGRRRDTSNNANTNATIGLSSPSAAGQPAPTGSSAGPSSHAESLGSSSSSSGGSGGSSSRVPRQQQQQPGDIEMESMSPAAAHRRRRSTLTNHPPHAGGPRGAGGAGAGRYEARASGGASGEDEPKTIAEEAESDADQGGGGLGRWRRTAAGQDSDDDIVSDEDLHDDEETGLTKRHRLRKREKRRRNTQLDQRIVRDGGGGISEEEKKEADKNVLRRSVVNVSLILLWYIFSLSISIYNKWMFDSKQLDFAFPLFTTSIHMLIQFSLACLVLYFFPSLRPRNGHKSDLGQSRHEAEPERPIMTKWFYFTRIGPCGAATGLDIGLGNTSLKLITLTFYTMCKSSALAFVLLFAFLFRLETPTWRLVAIIATMTVGVVMMVAGEVEFELGGFLLVISAAFFSGFRWGLTQILLLRNPATSNPFSSIFYLAPVMFVTLFSIAVVVEGFHDLIRGVQVLVEAKGAVAAPVIVLFPGAIAFLMTVSEFALLQRTSVVTLSIAGIFKEVVTISAAALVFGDVLTPINFSGLIVTMAAICSYNYIKITKMREEARASAAHRVQQQQHDAGVGGGSGSSVSGGSDAENEAESEDAALLARDGGLEGGAGGGGGPGTPMWTVDGDMIVKPEGGGSATSSAGGAGGHLRPSEHQRED